MPENEYVYTMVKVRMAYPPDKVVLDDITLAFLPGAKIGVLGLNGAGKSTLLRIMAGEITPSNGDAIPGKGVKIGYLPQEPHLDESKDVRANVEEGVADRRALLDQLPAEQRPLAELVMRGGVPLVRETLEAQRVAATEAGHPPVQPGPVLDVAEKLNVHVRLAEWQDRAAAALDQAGEVDLRDLRSVVVAADGLARHEATREVADQLRVALGERVEAEHAAWLTELTELLDDGRTVRALRVSSHPPKAGSPLPPPLAARLAAAAAGELTAETSPSRYAAVVEVLALSPVRTQVTPAGVPATTPDELVATVRRFGDRLPQVAAAFGVEPLPPSRSRRPRKPAGPGGPPRPASPATPGT
jgi:energy-coupling factor transporter ATP-binding protein EcfA2